ncbi:MAG: hypothetical protein M3044_09820 [Thermoproteota archaeon]|nr:hypothetical protein [Thermoproteota archaeon]
MWDCDIESYDWFRRFDSRYFAHDLFTDLEKIEREFEDVFMDIKAPKEIMIDYETQEEVGVGEFSAFVYGYSMTVELDDKPHVSNRSSKKMKGVFEYDGPKVTSEREPLAEINVYDKGVKVVLEMPGVSKRTHQDTGV